MDNEKFVEVVEALLELNTALANVHATIAALVEQLGHQEEDETNEPTMLTGQALKDWWEKNG